jgi:hypothetical protein
MNEKGVRAELIKLYRGGINITSQSQLKLEKEYVDQALSALRTEIEGALPNVSMKLKLTAREKFIWLTALQEVRASLDRVWG